MNPSPLISTTPRIPPPLDPDFTPASLYNKAYRERLMESGGGLPLRIALERNDGAISAYECRVFPRGSPLSAENDLYVERIVKFLLWQRGGWKVWIGGPPEIGNYIRSTYSVARIASPSFDAAFMATAYEQLFTVIVTEPENVPEANESTTPLGRHLDGCRVGFDLGASDRKASAVINGEAVFSEEIAWDPKNQDDPEYHYGGIMDSINRAAAWLPHLDAVGGSAAGIYLNNRARAASLFRSIAPVDFDHYIADMFVRIARELGVPFQVANDGDVTALAGSMSIGDNPVLGIAMGSSEAAGYVNKAGNITGWLNELAFAPIDYSPNAPVDEWSGDKGCGVQYFSQAGAIRVAEGAGLKFDPNHGLPRKLEALQAKMAEADALAADVYRTLGCYLGYGIAHYADFYDLKHILVLGRVMTGPGGELMIQTAQEALQADFPDLAERIHLSLPDEKSRRVGQSIAAASLPSIS